VTSDPLKSRVEGGLTGMFRNQRKISFYFVQFLHSEVAWEAQSSIPFSHTLHEHKGDYAPGGSAPIKGCVFSVCVYVCVACVKSQGMTGCHAWVWL